MNKPFKRYAIAHHLFELMVWLSYTTPTQLEFLIEDMKEATASDGDGDVIPCEIMEEALRLIHKEYQGDK